MTKHLVWCRYFFTDTSARFLPGDPGARHKTDIESFIFTTNDGIISASVNCEGSEIGLTSAIKPIDSECAGA